MGPIAILLFAGAAFSSYKVALDLINNGDRIMGFAVLFLCIGFMVASLKVATEEAVQLGEQARSLIRRIRRR